MVRLLIAFIIVLAAPMGAIAQDAPPTKTLTLEKIMSDPDWMGRSPTGWYWSTDGKSILYSQKREGSRLTDLYSQSLTDEAGTVVSLSALHEHSTRGAVRNAGATQVAYVFEGNIFTKDTNTAEVNQITRSSARDSNPMYLTDGRLAFFRGNSVLAYDPSSGALHEIASVALTDAPKAPKPPKGFKAEDQAELIEFVAKEQQRAEERYDQRKALTEANESLTSAPIYLGKNKRIVRRSLSPDGSKMIIALADPFKRNPKDIMPNYITADGTIAAVPVRSKVGDNKPYSEDIYLLDFSNGNKTKLDYSGLSDYDTDVLAEVKKENAKAKGEKYKSTKKPRAISGMFGDSIKWNKDGSAVLLLLRAADYKDNWLVTVDPETGDLTEQYQHHDDAWVNKTRDFFWDTSGSGFYFTSEADGYAHIYHKNLGKKAKQLTQGAYEVSTPRMTRDGSSIFYRANKKHPGIYEIYHLDTATGESRAVTNLGGMNNYALSPDEGAILIQHSSLTMPPELYVQSVTNQDAKRMTHTISEEFLSYNFMAPEIVAVPSSNTDAPIYTRVYRPTEEKADRRGVMFIHGAGYLQNAHYGWSGYFREYMFHNMLAQQGYVVTDMDYRHSAGYGREWRAAVYRQMGPPELEDFADGVNWMVENTGVDRDRIGTYGGSYGGFMALMALFKEPDMFQAGAALRLVSDWAYYNHGYTAARLNTPDVDPIAYRVSSPIYYAEGLTKPLLMNAPMVDNNVFFQDTVRLHQRLIELEKDNFETAIFPVEPHGFREPSSWLDEYKRIYKLFEDNL